MKTHDAATALDSILSQSKNNINPNQIAAIKETIALLNRSPNYQLAEVRVMRMTDELAVSLLGLVALSKYSKQQWVKIIEEFSLPIELDPRASIRDVVGKVLRYLESHPEALRNHSKQMASSASKQKSPTLEDTLNKLINYK